MKLLLRGHDDRYAVEQLQLTCSRRSRWSR